MVVRYLYSGDSAITVEFGDVISESVSRRVIAMKKAIDCESIYGVEEVVVTYRSLLVYYSPYELSPSALIEEIKKLESRCEGVELSEKKIIEIPVCYDLEYGRDLRNIAHLSGLSVEEVIEKHLLKEYLVYMVGFTPGFPYMGKLCPELVSPRRDSPRLMVEKGSVAIAGGQTGIYPVDSPGGWNIIGRTPVRLYDFSSESPTLVKAGDYVKFIRVDRGKFNTIEQLVESGLYRCSVRFSKE